ncbi:hypothetical protein D3C72_2063870 [compost metagenome]
MIGKMPATPSSPIFTTLIASWMLRMAWRLPSTWARRPSAIDNPAASSDARLMRLPDDSFSRDFSTASDWRAARVA